MNKVKIKTNYDDWMLVYVNDQLVYEGHAMHLTNESESGYFFRELNIELEVIETDFEE